MNNYLNFKSNNCICVVNNERVSIGFLPNIYSWIVHRISL